MGILGYTMGIEWVFIGIQRVYKGYTRNIHRVYKGYTKVMLNN